jgi:hypothetical protein
MQIETKAHCFKAFGEHVAARDLERQIAEIQSRITL